MSGTDPAALLAGLQRLAGELDLRSGDAERAVARALRGLLASTSAEAFSMEAAIGLHPAWRADQRRRLQQDALRSLVRFFPEMSLRETAGEITRAAQTYRRARWPRDSRTGHRPDGLDGAIFDLLLRNRMPSETTLPRKLQELSVANFPPPAATGKSRDSASSEVGMALMAKLRNGTDPASVPQLQDDPDFAAATDLAGAINQRIGRLGRERDRVILENRYAGRPVNEIKSDDPLWQRLLRLRQEPPMAPQAQTNTKAATPAIAAALAILSGNPAVPPPTFQERIEEIDCEIGQLGDAARDQNDILHRIAGELSFAACSAAQARWNKLQGTLYHDALALSRTMASIHSLEAEIISAGATFRGDLLRMPDVMAPRCLGSESEFCSEISGWRRTLAGWGVI